MTHETILIRFLYGECQMFVNLERLVKATAAMKVNMTLRLMSPRPEG